MGVLPRERGLQTEESYGVGPYPFSEGRSHLVSDRDSPRFRGVCSFAKDSGLDVPPLGESALLVVSKSAASSDYSAS
jgi:hypothetical protein